MRSSVNIVPRAGFVRLSLAFTVLSMLAAFTSLAFQRPEVPGRFDAVAIQDPTTTVIPTALEIHSMLLPPSMRSAWSGFKNANGEDWDVHVDARSGAPLLVQGRGIAFIPGSGNSLQSSDRVTLPMLEQLVRDFMGRNADLFMAADEELVLNEVSGQITPDLWQVQFNRVVGGVPVARDGYVFYVGHGNLISFGAIRWSKITTDASPTLTPAAARVILMNYMGIKPQDVAFEDPDGLLFEPMAAAATGESDFSGPVGTGYQTALVWRIKMRIEGESGMWIGLVDAHTGAVLGLESDTKNAQAKGGIYPITNDAICPTGCEQPNFPMPYADIAIDGVKGSATTGMGSFTCSPSGSSATTTLQGPYFKIVDTCGAISKAVTCDQDLDMGTSAGTDCTTPGSGGTGNTHSARSAFYHLNRIAEHGRGWLPSDAWLQAQLPVNLNINLTCNANGSGTSLNFYKSGGGCPNSGEIASVFLHEWGHGLDATDGGGFESPAEAYADITSFLVTHQSCIGRGWTPASNCGGYGDACTSCTGIREMDWAKLASNTPRTPSNFPASCAGADNGGVGPCNKGSHCEAYLAGQTFWDLATRDLPAAGIDQQTAWQIVDRTWFISRNGSAGPGYGCGATASQRSCAVTAWMQQIRVLDDEDGNLANGTPHAAAIFAAFNRHQIACGLASDLTNLSTTGCPSLTTPVVTATSNESGSVQLAWPAPAPNVARWNVLRNDQGCNWGQTLIANTSSKSFTEGDLPNGRPVYYVVQPLGSNPSCVGASSACISTFAMQISNNGPICTGGTLNLTASTIAGATYAWTGPNGFASTAQNPGIANTTAAAAGTYTVTVTLGSATSTASTIVAVRGLNQACDDGNRCTTDTCLTTNHVNESFDAGVPPNWTTEVLPPSPAGTNGWFVTNQFSFSPPNSGATDAPSNVSDKVLYSPTFVPSSGSTVHFKNRYNLESGFDGAVLEIKFGAAPFADIISAGGVFINGAYTQTISTAHSNPIGGRSAWSGSSGAFLDTEVSLPPASIGQITQLRWRVATDNSFTPPAPNGEWIDDVRVSGSAISCQATSQVVCTASDACHTVGTCNSTTGLCSNPALAEGAACNDGIDCTGPDACTSLPAVMTFNTVTAPALPAGWSSTVDAGNPWTTTTAPPVVGPPNSVSTDSPASSSDKKLQSAPYHIAPGATAVLEFDNWYNLERGLFPDSAYDGAVLEIKIGGGSFTNIVTAGGSFVTGGYNASIVGISALNGQQGWSGSSRGFVHTKVNLPAAASGQTVVLRWRMATDFSVAATAPNGQRIDNVRVSNDLSACGGVTLVPPAEVTTDRFLPDKTTFTWTAVPTASTYDIVSGDIPALPVGPGGGDENYNTCGSPGLTFSDPNTPSSGFGWFYIVRGRNQSCPGSYGTQSGGVPRTTTTCP